MIHFKQRLGLPLLAFLLTLCGAANVSSGVITSGCASASGCSLAELYAGGSITINDVTFDSWFENLNDGGVDTGSVFVMAVDEVADGGDPSLAHLGLQFTAEPALNFEFLEYDFDFSVYFNSGARSFSGASLILDQFSLVGDAFAEVNAGLSPGLLSVDQDSNNSNVAIANSVAIAADFDIQMEIFDDFSDVHLNQFTFLLDIYQDQTTTPLPEPTSLWLLLGALAALYQRRQRRQHNHPAIIK